MLGETAGARSVMLRKHWCQACERCGEVTPHSARRISLPLIAAVGTGLVASLLLARDVGALAAIAAIAGGVTFAADRQSGAAIRCERCRWKHRVAERRTACDPRDPSTLIHLW